MATVNRSSGRAGAVCQRYVSHDSEAASQIKTGQLWRSKVQDTIINQKRKKRREEDEMKEAEETEEEEEVE